MELWYVEHYSNLIQWYCLASNKSSALSNINYSIGNGEAVRLRYEELGSFTCMLTMSDEYTNVMVF